MTHDKVSAIPDRLDSYAERATAMDAELLSTTASVRNRLEHFEARCTEPGFTIHASGLVDPVRRLAHECDTVDKQVGEVGGRFRMADSRWGSYRTSSHPSGFEPPGSTGTRRGTESVTSGSWSLGPIPVPGWLIRILLFLPWVQSICPPESSLLPAGRHEPGAELPRRPTSPFAEAAAFMWEGAEQKRRAADALQEVYGLKPDEWQQLSIERRLAVVQEVEDALADAQGRKPRRVVGNKIDWNGQYTCIRQEDPCYEDSEIWISTQLLRGDDLDLVLTTIAHEGRHAYQRYAIENPGFHDYERQVEAWRNNWTPEGYCEPADCGFRRYRSQPIEADAWHYQDGFAASVSRTSEN